MNRSATLFVARTTASRGGVALCTGCLGTTMITTTTTTLAGTG
ncbi:hypothetical protein [Brevundimonas sp. TWP2-3-4b2]